MKSINPSKNGCFGNRDFYRKFWRRWARNAWKKLVDHGGITFETQELPGAERLESFGDVTLEPNQVREFVTEYKINKYKEIE